MNESKYRTANPEQIQAWIEQALKQEGFDKTPNAEIYFKDHKNDKLVVDLTAGTSVYFKVGKQRVDTDDEAGTLSTTRQMIEDAKDGIMPTKSEADIVYTRENQAEPLPETESHEMIPAEHAYIAPMTYQPELSIDVIKKYINDKATDEEAYVFLQLCKSRGLNPFVGDAYLIKYDHTSTATTVVGKDAFMKRAELNPNYDGFEAGVIIKADVEKGFVERVGSFVTSEDEIIGAWAKVHRKDRKQPVHITVSMKEYDTGKSSWKNRPATMIRKVAIVQAMREAFPSELSGMYDQSEMGVDVHS